MFKTFNFFTIVVVIMIANRAIGGNRKCLRDLFETVIDECPSASSTKDGALASIVCSFKALGLRKENDEYITPTTPNQEALIDFAKAVDECAESDSFDSCGEKAGRVLESQYKCEK